jgi:cell division protein FtsZ
LRPQGLDRRGVPHRRRCPAWPGIQGIPEVITLAGIINLTCRRATDHERGRAPLLAIGKGRGENCAADAARAAITQLCSTSASKAPVACSFNIVGGKNLGLMEVNQAAEIIRGVVSPEAEIVFGAALDPDLGDEVKVTTIATVSRDLACGLARGRLRPARRPGRR